MKYQDIFDALAAMTVTASGKTPTAYPPQTAGAISSAQIPARIIMPFGEYGAFTQVENLAANSGDAEITWRLSDICLWEAAGLSRGLNDVTPALVAYAEAYMSAARGARDIAPGCVIRSVSITLKPHTYNGISYWAVACDLTITEYAPKGQ